VGGEEVVKWFHTNLAGTTNRSADRLFPLLNTELPLGV
jgi:hypothetical protein